MGVPNFKCGSCAGFILARIVRVKNGNGRKFMRKKIMATSRPTHFKWQLHRGSVTHSTLLHMRSKLVVLGELWFLFARNG